MSATVWPPAFQSSGGDEPDAYLFHPTDVIVIGTRNGVQFKAKVPAASMWDFLAKCDREFNGPKP